VDQESDVITIRRSEDRGHANHGWLDSRFTFSFADYHDQDMEILTYVLEGAVAHKDSVGNATVIRPGELQRMTAGTGVRHSESNPSPSEDLHLLQIWILPEKRGLKPGYEQRAFPPEELAGKLRLIAHRDGKDAVTLHQDAAVYAAKLAKGEVVEHVLAKGRHAWIHVARGGIQLNGERLKEGDGAAISEEPLVRLEGENAAEVLLFDLA
jgi:redox-sensitive bicupin YhaK (pirin superfamily)